MDAAGTNNSMMYRIPLILAATWVLTLSAPRAFGQDRPALKEALALQEALRDAIKSAEPSVACILVSRSDWYRVHAGYEPPADNPGKLGSFDANLHFPQPRMERGWRGRGMRGRMMDQPADERPKYDMAHSNYVPEAFGSGVVIDGEKLLILTHYHVIHDATKVYVRVGDRGCYADIYAADPRSDLAVLQLLDEQRQFRSLPEIRMGDGSAVQKGDFIVTLTNPFAAGFRGGSPSASWGIVSGLHRRGAPLMSSEEDVPGTAPIKGLLPLKGTLIETDARLNAGCSGGALLNLRGELVGLTTSRAAITGSETAGGFAVPMDANFKRIIDRLKRGQEVEYGFLGVSGSMGRDGIVINPDGVTHGSPAQEANLQAGDVIKSINGVRMRDFDDLMLTVGSLLAGSEARIEIEGKRDLVRVSLVKSFVPGKIIATNRPPAVRGFRVDYTSVLFLQSTARPMWRGNFGIQPGVYVREVLPESPAATARLKVNEIITHVNNQPVNSPAEFYQVVEKIGPRTPLELTLVATEWRGSTTSTLTIP
jgi:serine protease Do